MIAGIIVFPGINRERDMAKAVEAVSGRPPRFIWHAETTLPPIDLAIVPGGFSYGDYLRSGAIAARAPIMADLVRKAAAGLPVLGVCNGFQILTEAGLLPGVLMRNRDQRFVCRDVHLRVETNRTRFTHRYGKGQIIRVPVAHGDGNYFADTATVDRLEGEDQVVFRYAEPDGTLSARANPNGSTRNIAGIVSAAGNVLGLMPHPENLIDPLFGGTDGRGLFESLFSQAA